MKFIFLRKIVVILSLSSFSLLLVSCGGQDKSDVKTVIVDGADKGNNESRWYTKIQQIKGKKVFKNNCMTCHGEKGQGLTVDWKKPDVAGKFPAPPLNGTAHTWHHSKALLLRTINNGGIPLGGTMPAFNEKLSNKEKEAVLAYIMSLWPDKTYSLWKQRNPN